MKKVLWSLALLSMTSGIAAAQDVNELVPAPGYQAAPERPLDKALIANEHKINEAVAKGDKAAFTALVSADATSIDGMGLMKVSDFAAMLDQVKITNWKISDETVAWADPNTAIVTYKWTGSGTFQGQPVPAQTYCSTVWTKKGDKWVAVFHQESEAVKPAAAKK
jgi:ketosteroid isomerase-like protein